MDDLTSEQKEEIKIQQELEELERLERDQQKQQEKGGNQGDGEQDQKQEDQDGNIRIDDQNDNQDGKEGNEKYNIEEYDQNEQQEEEKQADFERQKQLDQQKQDEEEEKERQNQQDQIQYQKQQEENQKQQEEQIQQQKKEKKQKESETKSKNSQELQDTQQMNDSQKLQQIKENFSNIQKQKHEQERLRNKLKQIANELEHQISNKLQKPKKKLPPPLQDISTPRIQEVRNKIKQQNLQIKDCQNQIKKINSSDFKENLIQMRDLKNQLLFYDKEVKGVQQSNKNLKHEQETIMKQQNNQNNQNFIQQNIEDAKVQIEELRNEIKNIDKQEKMNNEKYEKARLEAFYLEKQFREGSLKSGFLPHLFGNKKSETPISLNSEKKDFNERFKTQRNTKEDKMFAVRPKAQPVDMIQHYYQEDKQKYFKEFIEEIENLKNTKGEYEKQFRVQKQDLFQQNQKLEVEIGKKMTVYAKFESEVNTFIAKQNELCHTCSHRSTPELLQLIRNKRPNTNKESLVYVNQKDPSQHPIKDTIKWPMIRGNTRNIYGFFGNNNYCIPFDDTLFYGKSCADQGLSKLIIYEMDNIIVGVKQIFNEFEGVKHVDPYFDTLQLKITEIDNIQKIKAFTGQVTDYINYLEMQFEDVQYTFGKKQEETYDFSFQMKEEYNIISFFGTLNYNQHDLLVNISPNEQQKLNIYNKDTVNEADKKRNSEMLENYKRQIEQKPKLPKEDAFMALSSFGLEYHDSSKKFEEIQEDIQESEIKQENKIKLLQQSRKIQYKIKHSKQQSQTNKDIQETNKKTLPSVQKGQQNTDRAILYSHHKKEAAKQFHFMQGVYK